MDHLSKEARSLNMSRIRSGNTKPELIVRSILHRLGYRFRLHKKELPGTPDIVLRKHKAVIFVHGCFWHQHENCKYANMPKSNTEYWMNKLQRNTERDSRAVQKLAELGWRVLVIWECQTKDAELTADIINNFFDQRSS